MSARPERDLREQLAAHDLAAVRALRTRTASITCHNRVVVHVLGDEQRGAGLVGVARLDALEVAERRTTSWPEPWRARVSSTPWWRSATSRPLRRTITSISSVGACDAACAPVRQVHLEDAGLENTP